MNMFRSRAGGCLFEGDMERNGGRILLTVGRCGDGER